MIVSLMPKLFLLRAERALRQAILVSHLRRHPRDATPPFRSFFWIRSCLSREFYIVQWFQMLRERLPGDDIYPYYQRAGCALSWHSSQHTGHLGLKLLSHH